MTDRLKQFLPADVTKVDEIPQLYSAELLRVTTGESFERFLYKWDYWQDKEVRQAKLKASDWEWISESLVIIRSDAKVKKENLEDKRFKIPLALAVPYKFLLVAIKAQQFKVPWGLVYHKMREEKIISF